MKRIHPNVSHAAALAVVALSLGAGGCRNQSGGMANPFLAPNRVPPPATRALQPGQAQPYYPGDPLPVMHSGTSPAGGDNTLAAASSQMPSVDTNLSWTSPGSSTVASNPAPQPRAIAISNEPTVAIPADGDALRYALPAPVEPELFTPIAPVALASSLAPIQLDAAPRTQGVLPASYAAPTGLAMEPVAAPNPWQTPQIAPSSAVASTAPPYLPITASPIPVAPNNMNVRLRAVASPPIDPNAGSTPRIRLPGYPAPEPAVSSNDGFRPRSSMR